MKQFVSIVILTVLAVILFLPTTAVMQEGSPLPTPVVEPEFPPIPIELPETAAQALEKLIAWVTLFGGYVTYHLTRWIRKRLPMVDDVTRSKIAGLGANLVAAISATVIGLIVAYGTVGADFLDANGIWAVIKLVGGALGGAEVLFVARKWAK